MIESIFITTAINAKEHRDVAIIHLSRAFLHAPIDEKVIMFMKGKMAELMAHVAPQIYPKYITTKAGEKILYMRVQKVLYGMLKSVFLFYMGLCQDLESQGFEINPYDPCMANKIIDEYQMTVVWHVDDLKISHKHPCEITKMAMPLSNDMVA